MRDFDVDTYLKGLVQLGSKPFSGRGFLISQFWEVRNPHPEVDQALLQKLLTKKGYLMSFFSFLFTDRTKSLKQNIQMTAPIMSRFDLFFILVDDCNEVTDYAIARRIIDLHTRAEQSVDRTYEPDDISRYIR